jgi:hypothetical protein
MKKFQLVIIGLFIIMIWMFYFFTKNIENLETTKSVAFSGRKNYDTNNYDVQYHESIKQIEERSSSGSWLIGSSGKLEFVPWSEIASQVTYYPTGAYEYGATTWTPTYEESVLLGSKVTSMSN